MKREGHPSLSYILLRFLIEYDFDLQTNHTLQPFVASSFRKTILDKLLKGFGEAVFSELSDRNKCNIVNRILVKFIRRKTQLPTDSFESKSNVH
jgi:hypothetical protein